MPKERFSQEAIDSLRLESSAISPHQAVVLQNHLSEARDILATLYGTFLPSKTLKNWKTMSQRIIVVDKSTMSVLFSEKAWRQNSIHSHVVEEAGGFYDDKANVSFALQRGIHDSISTDDDRANFELLASFLYYSMEEAILLVANLLKLATAIHETLHAVTAHNPNIRLAFKFTEAATSYYTYMLLMSMHLPVAPTSFEEKNEISEYVNLIKKFGDDVHRLYFGTEVEDAIAQEILITTFNWE